jgi:hypothetical protein
MSFDVCAVDAEFFRDVPGCGQSFESLAPEPLRAPTIVTVIYRGRGTIFGWTVLPPAARAQHVENTADDPAVVYPVRTRPGPVPKPNAPCGRRVELDDFETDLSKNMYRIVAGRPSPAVWFSAGVVC